MEEYRFGANQAAPRCWGKNYTEGDRECRGCGFQESCKSEIIRNGVNRQPMYQTAVPQQFQQYPQQPAPHVQVPSYQPPARVPSRFFVGGPQTNQYAPPQPVYQPQQAYQQPQYPPQYQQQQYAPPQNQQYGYGWVNDPMHHYVHSIPPPHRPQMPGESFGERMVKNIGLSMMESLFANMFLSIRQMMWTPEQQNPYVDAVPLTQPVPQPPQK